MATIGERIRQLRSSQGFTQARLAEVLHVSKSAVSKWESNTNLPQAMELKNMSSLFHVRSDYLLGLSNQPAAGSAGGDKKLAALTAYFQQLEREESKQRCLDFVISQLNEQETAKMQAELLQKTLDEPKDHLPDVKIIVDADAALQELDK
ncbi:helix-turn-helix domain-containing protein [Streptococcus panodentis]|uniref:XRE family transcriptional regulator n=1 Tax=Streptococcus panodentis TaxID=1581472 RepID=A0ABS5AV85_9STRE|nr:helix-turn-helix transcriptional regulator [Streptococcus panodentis]MBP2620488.1 XRE family transcriptional regulator [Streptococcus panodentis]